MKNVKLKSCARHVFRDEDMIKKLLLASLFAFVVMPTVNAQESYLSENRTNDTVQVQEKTKRSISKHTMDERRFAVSIQIVNANKMGVGVKFSYDFTDILRFSIDGNYYFYQWGRRFNTITEAGVKGHDSWGRRFDINPNLNFVFGRKNFHFYVITGFYFSMGNSKTGSVLEDIGSVIWDDESSAPGVYIDREYYYYKEKLPIAIGFGFNAGCGIEYQINKSCRIYLDQHWAIGFQSAWMGELGFSYCF